MYRSGTLALALSLFILASCGEPAQGGVNDEAITLLELTGYELTDRDREVLVEERIATCMGEKGFDYTPEPVSANPDLSPLAPELDIEQVQQTGYGIAEKFLEGFKGSAEVGQNQQYVSFLGASEREQYMIALWGRNPQPGETFTLGGCRSEARHAMAVDGEELYFSLLAGLAEQIDQRLAASPEFIDATESWTSCMASAGHEYESRVAIQAALVGELEQLLVPSAARPGVLQMSPEEREGATFSDLFTDEALAHFAELQKREIRIALDDARCSEPLTAVVSRLAAEVEEDFVANYLELVR